MMSKVAREKKTGCQTGGNTTHTWNMRKLTRCWWWQLVVGLRWLADFCIRFEIINTEKWELPIGAACMSHKIHTKTADWKTLSEVKEGGTGDTAQCEFVVTCWRLITWRHKEDIRRNSTLLYTCNLLFKMFMVNLSVLLTNPANHP